MPSELPFLERQLITKLGFAQQKPVSPNRFAARTVDTGCSPEGRTRRVLPGEAAHQEERNRQDSTYHHLLLIILVSTSSGG